MVSIPIPYLDGGAIPSQYFGSYMLSAGKCQQLPRQVGGSLGRRIDSIGLVWIDSVGMIDNRAQRIAQT